MVTESELRPRQSAGAECPSVEARCGLELEANLREVTITEKATTMIFESATQFHVYYIICSGDPYMMCSR